MSDLGLSVCWIVVRDDGTSQLAEESIDSVWAAEAGANGRANELRAEKGLSRSWSIRVERWEVRSVDKEV